MSTHEQAIEAANKKLHSIIGAGNYIHVNLAAETIAAYLSSRGAVLCSAEPVAWRYRVTNGEGKLLDGWRYSDEPGTLDLRQPLYAPLSPADTATAGRVEVKALEWKYLATPPSGEEYASSSVGTYYIELGYKTYTAKVHSMILGVFSSLDTAKEFCTNDYKTRILSALTHPQPSNGDEVERLREALQTVVDWAALALKNPGEFNSHGVRLLDGPAFDAARAALKGSSHDQR